MDLRKIYCYHKLDIIDKFDAIDWARENFDFYDGETSPLWAECVQQEFLRLKKERDEKRQDLCRVLNYIIGVKQLNEDIVFLDDDFIEICE